MYLQLKYLGRNMALAIVLSFVSINAHALLVTTSVEGYVTLDNGGNNPFGLLFDDAIYASVSYDDALVLGNSPDEMLYIDGMAGWDFNVTLGSYSFSQSDVTDPSYSVLFFNNGVFDGLRFYLDPVDIGNYLELQIEDFNGGRALFVEDSFSLSGVPEIYLEAEWDFSTAVTRPVDVISVPEPSTFVLMLAGILALSFSKKKKVS